MSTRRHQSAHIFVIRSCRPESNSRHLYSDVFDKDLGRFWSRARFHARLAAVARAVGDPAAAIAAVPVIAKQSFEKPADLLPLLETKSRFRADGGTVEGVYLRIDGEVGESAAAGTIASKGKLYGEALRDSDPAAWCKSSIGRSTCLQLII